MGKENRGRHINMGRKPQRANSQTENGAGQMLPAQHYNLQEEAGHREQNYICCPCHQQQGVKPDPEKLKAIKEIPRPTNVTEIKSFMGLANQLTNCNPDIAHMGTLLRALTQTGVAWQWTPDAERERRRQPASTLRFQKPLCQQRYSTIELECLAIQLAVMKCDYYRRGLPSFDVLTNHRHLVGLFQKDLHTVDTPRLLRLHTREANMLQLQCNMSARKDPRSNC